MSLIATHFEFFNTRVFKRRALNVPLFSERSMERSENSNYQYVFQETISLVMEIVRKCCIRMSRYYVEVMRPRFESIEEYLQSNYVYGDANVLHGERIIHTHIRYIDTYRLFVINEIEDSTLGKEINEILVNYIKEYINIGEENPIILTTMSTKRLFPKFKKQIKKLRSLTLKTLKHELM